MKRLQKAAVLVDLSRRLKEKGSWCGETHIQKAAYFLQEVLRVPTDCDFILYKYGPFSFDLRDDLTALLADGIFELILQPNPYGPSMRPTELGYELTKRYPKTLEKYSSQLQFVAERLGSKRGAECECLATALYVTREVPGGSVEQRAKLIHELKPHVSLEMAESSVSDVDQIVREAPASK